MKYFYLALLCLTCACVQKNSVSHNAVLNRDSLCIVLLETDKSWSDLSLKAGYFHSRKEFLTDSAIEMMQGAMPLNGKKAILDYTAAHPDSSFTMQWNPLRADVASSGDLGYTYGAWEMKTKTKAGADTSLFGNYLTVWQRQADGSWKYIVDGGNDTPQRVEK